MSTIRPICAGLIAGCLASSPAWALNPPAVPQALSDWNYVFDMNTADPSDDGTTGFFVEPTGQMAISLDCSDFDQPVGQPKPPDGCGVLDPDPGDPGFWLYYDGDGVDAPPGGWNQANRWWRNRLILRVADDTITYFAKPVTDPTSAACADPSPCPSGSLKFCGFLNATDGGGTSWSGGSFSACIAPE